MKQLLKCEITIRTADKNWLVYGLFRSSFDAYLEALNAHGNKLCYVKVRVL